MKIKAYDKKGRLNIDTDDYNRFVAIDFETMDILRSSVCSIGICVFENDKMIDSFYSLVCPPTKAENKYCVQTHGLHYNDVKNAPNFPAIWEKVDKEYIKNSPLIAHNVPFERSCINACNEWFGTKNDYIYVDTLTLSRQKLWLNENTLDRVCQRLKVKLKNHHNAYEDAKACGEIFIKMKNNFV